MSIEDYAKSLLREVGVAPASKPATPNAETQAAKQKPAPNKPDPEEVQYPGYFKGHGSL